MVQPFELRLDLPSFGVVWPRCYSLCPTQYRHLLMGALVLGKGRTARFFVKSFWMASLLQEQNPLADANTWTGVYVCDVKPVHGLRLSGEATMPYRTTVLSMCDKWECPGKHRCGVLLSWSCGSASG